MKFKWTKTKQEAFKEIKRIVDCDVLLAYLDINDWFKIHTNDSDLILGEIIIQNGEPIYFYSRKLTDPPKSYTIPEKELLSIVETLKEFRAILLGQGLKIYTDNKKLTYVLNTNRVLRLRLILEEHGTDIEYIQGSKNIVADALSRLPTNGNKETTQGYTSKSRLCQKSMTPKNNLKVFFL